MAELYNNAALVERASLLPPRLTSQLRNTSVTQQSAGQAGSSQARLNVLFLKRFWSVMRVAFPHVCSKSFLLFLILVFARSAEEYNIYQSGLLPSKFYAALIAKDSEAFKQALWISAVVVASVCVCKSASTMLAGLLYVHWRGLISQFLHTRYFRGTNYYHLNLIDLRIDNPDQRITQDVDRFCEQLSEVIPKIVISPFTIAYYTYLTYHSMGYIGPVCIYAYFLVSTVINKFIMGPIISLVFRQERQEGNFRFHHVQVRASAESLAFYQAGNLEGEKSNRLLKSLLHTQRGVVHWQFLLNMSVNVFDYVSAIISYSLVGITVFSGKYDGLEPSQLSSVISKNAFVSMYLLNKFSTLVDTAVSFTDIAGYTHRIGELIEALRQLNTRKKEESKEEEKEEREKEDSEEDSKSETLGKIPSINSNRHPLPRHSLPPQCTEFAAVLSNLSVAPPQQTIPLVEGLNLQFKKGKNILILGDSGSGKSSILRVLRDLWKPLQGSAYLCPDGSHHYVMFLPQKPYLTSGSLADQVAFPEKPKLLTDLQVSSTPALFVDRINEALQMAGLIFLVERLGGINTQVQGNWHDIVSPGETQKIAFARLFYHKPPFAILDEASCSLSENSEHYFYTTLQQLGITVLSVGHRSTLRKDQNYERIFREFFVYNPCSAHLPWSYSHPVDSLIASASSCVQPVLASYPGSRSPPTKSLGKRLSQCTMM